MLRTSLFVLHLAACSTDPESAATAPQKAGANPSAPPRPNVVLVTIDTLRADRLGLYGHDRPTSPWLDALAAQGAVFERCISTSSWTPPAMASMMTGVYPHQHGYDTAAVQRDVVASMPVLSPEHDTLAERLLGAGLATWAVTTNHHLSKERGFAQGVQYFRGLGMTDDGGRALQLIETSQEALRETAPFLLWTHLLDPHGPYWRMEPHASTFDAGLESAFPGSAETREARLSEHHTVAVGGIEDPSRYAKGSVELETLQVLYDSEIRHTDALVARIGALFPPSENTIWVVTSDHGEEFRDHGNLGHRNPLYEHQVRVPLIVAWPGHIPPQRVQTPVSLVDLLPTLVELVSGEAPTVPSGGGTSFAPALRAGEEPTPRTVLAEVRRPQGSERMVREGALKLRLPDNAPPVLRNLATDPSEQGAPLEDPSATARLQAWLAEHDAASAVLPAQEQRRTLDPEERAQLEAMGYLDDDGKTD